MAEKEPRKSWAHRILALDEMISGLPGMSYVSRAVDWLRNSPLGFTIASSVAATLISLGSDSGSVLEDAIMGAFIGGSVDGVRHYEMSRKKAELDKLGNLAKVFSFDYLQALGSVLAEEKGIDSKISTFDSVTLGNGGTSIFGGGHFDLVTFTYKNGEKTKALIKASRKRSSRTGFEISGILNDMFSFVPKPYSIGRYAKPLTESDAPDQSSIPRRTTNPPIGTSEPCAFEFVEGECLEGRMNCDMPSMESYDWVADAVPFDAIFDNMFEVYEFGKGDERVIKPEGAEGPHRNMIGMKKYPLAIVGEHEQAYKLLKTLKGFCGDEDEFVNDWWATRRSEFEGAPLTLIHGDLHQGNVILGDETHIFDWDNAQKNIPYQDFINLSVFTDLDKASDYEQIREDFKKRQAEMFPEITEEQMKITEFETYMGWAERFGRETLSGQIRPVDREHMLSTSKYLLEKSRRALEEYAEMTGRYDLVGKYNSFIGRSSVLSEVDKTEFNPMASVGYAHSTHQRHTIQPIEDVAHLNIRKDAAYGERVILHNHKDATIPLAAAAVVTGATGLSIGLCLYHGIQQGADAAEWAGAMATLLPISALAIGGSLFTYFVNGKMFIRGGK